MHQSKGFEHPRGQTVACNGEEDLEPLDLAVPVGGVGPHRISGRRLAGGPGSGATTTRTTGYPGRTLGGAAGTAVSEQLTPPPRVCAWSSRFRATSPPAVRSLSRSLKNQVHRPRTSRRLPALLHPCRP